MDYLYIYLIIILLRITKLLIATSTEFDLISTPDLTQDEKDAGALDRHCGTMTISYSVGGEEASQTLFAIFEKDRLGWSGLYGPHDEAFFSDEDGEEVRSESQREMWELKGCGRAEEPNPSCAVTSPLGLFAPDRARPRRCPAA